MGTFIIGFIGGFIIGQIVLIGIVVIGADRSHKREPTKEEWKEEGFYNDYYRYGSLSECM